MVNLERNPAYTEHNIPLDSNNFYRGISTESYNDLWETDENGNQVMKGYGKGGTDRLSFQAKYPNALYVNSMVKSNTIIEGTSAMPIDWQEKRSGYTFVEPIERDKVESGEIPMRVYQRRALGWGAIEAVHDWHLIFDSFPKPETE